MKKYMLSGIMLLCALMTGCGNAAQDGNANPSSAVAESGDSVNEGSLNDLYSDKFVTLGEYKGLEATFNSIEPTAEEIDNRIQMDLSAATEKIEVTGRAVQSGDTVNIDYVGKKDGVAFDGGTASGYDLKIGSGQFIPGFEDGLIGANIGDTIDLNLTFPEQYHSAELAGADVVFSVTINGITEEKIPELSDDVVAGIGNGYDSVDAYKNSIKAELMLEKKNTAMSNVKSELLKAAVSNSTINEVPQWLIEELTSSVRGSAENYAMTYGVSLETFVSQALNETMEEFEAECAQFGKENAEQVLVVYAIANKENLKISDDELKKSLDEYMTGYGLSEEEMKSSGQEKYMTEYLQTEKITEFLLDNASLKDAAGNAVSAEE